MNKVIQALLVSSTSTVYHSSVVAMGSANSAMIEGWLISMNSDPTVTVTLEGSNDQQVWDATPADASGTPTAVTFDLDSPAPKYNKDPNTLLIPYAFLRLAVTMSGGTSPAALIDAGIRTFHV